MSDHNYTLIRDLPVEERPRERLERYGEGMLSVSELLAIILRVGNTRVSALQLAQKLISHFGGLRNLAAASIQEMSQISGIGLAKACQLKAAFELGKRLSMSTEALNPVITSPLSAANLVMEEMRYLKKEHCKALFLDTRNQVIAQQNVSVGSLNASIVHPRETFQLAIKQNAAAVILIHNHPSGDPTPSKEDLALTARMKEAGELIGISVLDHLIIGDGIYVSLKERGMM